MKPAHTWKKHSASRQPVASTSSVGFPSRLAGAGADLSEHAEIRELTTHMALIAIEGCPSSYSNIIDWQDKLFKAWQHMKAMSTIPCNQFFGGAPFMGREPVGLPLSGKVHTWLPWPAQRTPRPETWHAVQAHLFSQPCDVREANGAICKVL
eukprot:1156890-Pelagomonas_calceolata.AAC.3